jgi:hypothetical protein
MDVLATAASMDSEDQNEDAKPSAATTVCRRGPGYSQREDLMICQSFMAASENAKVGTSQTAQTFKDTIYCYYCLKMPNGSSQRSSTCIYKRFGKISQLVSKFIAIEKTHPQPSGFNHDGYYKMLSNIFLKREGIHFTDYYQCYLYLKVMPKWKEWCANAESNKMVRPKGNKLAVKEEKIEKLVHTAVKECIVSIKSEDSDISPMSGESPSGVYTVHFNAMLEQDRKYKRDKIRMQFISMLPEPRRIIELEKWESEQSE